MFSIHALDNQIISVYYVFLVATNYMHALCFLQRYKLYASLCMKIDDEIVASPREKQKRGSDAAEVDLDEYYDPELKEPAVKTVAQAVGLAEQLKYFSQYYGHEELSCTLSKVNDTLNYIKKTSENNNRFFFLLEIHIGTLIAFPTRKLR